MNHGILTAWQIWDYIYEHCTRLQYIDKKNNIFRIVILRYRGEPLYTGDNQVIQSGDPIVKLHIHNCRLAKKFKDETHLARLGLRLRREILDSLPMLAHYVYTNEACQNVKGIVGTTLLYRGAQGLGFHVSDVKENWFYRYKTAYLKLMMLIMHPDGKKRLHSNRQDFRLKRVYMSRDELINRYLKKE